MSAGDLQISHAPWGLANSCVGRRDPKAIPKYRLERRPMASKSVQAEGDRRARAPRGSPPTVRTGGGRGRSDAAPGAAAWASSVTKFSTLRAVSRAQFRRGDQQTMRASRELREPQRFGVGTLLQADRRHLGGRRDRTPLRCGQCLGGVADLLKRVIESLVERVGEINHPVLRAEHQANSLVQQATFGEPPPGLQQAPCRSGIVPQADIRHHAGGGRSQRRLVLGSARRGTRARPR